MEKEGNPKQKLIHLEMTMTMLVMRMYDDGVDDDDDDADDENDDDDDDVDDLG